jgi:glycosyltransferase involved in cell wall biosynthesis
VWCDNLLFRLFAVHFFAFYLNRHQGAKVLSSNSTFFYDTLPFLSKRIKKIELLHNFSHDKRGMEYFGLANYRYLDHRMVIDAFTYENIATQYRKYNVDNKYLNRVMIAEYGVNIPQRIQKPATPPLKILYAGRGTHQKRVWLICKIASYFFSKKMPVEFTFAGPLDNELTDEVKKQSNVPGEVHPDKMNGLFSSHHVILLTSAFEGFPVVIKQGMAHGCIPVVTALPANKMHLKHLDNALLIESPEDEEMVVRNGISNIELLLDQPQLVESLSSNAYDYASEHFTKVAFMKVYRNLLTN